MGLSEGIAERINKLFLGLVSAHGVYIYQRKDGHKEVGKCNTIRESVTVEKWHDHIEGKIGIGIVPINEANEVNWCVIDIDIYPPNMPELFGKIENSPFVLCRSKSGGVHLFIFFMQPTSARDAREYLRNQVSVLGLGNSEIFPKQDEIVSSRGDVGNWLNMPYFGDTRKCYLFIDDKEVDLDIEDFLDYAESKKVLIEELQKTGTKIDYEKSPLKDGPPCLQTLSLQGFPVGTRNVALFNLGVYAMKASPTNWVKLLESYNRAFFATPLSSKETQVIIRSLDKKEYFYQCQAEPLCSFCNAKLCRTRKYGIAGSTSMPIINSVTKVAGDTSIWFIDVEGGRLELTTEELYDNRRFRMKCVNALNVLPSKMKDEDWQTYLQSILDKAVIITDEGMFRRTEIPEYFYQFMLARATRDINEVNSGRVVFHAERQEVYFKMESFINYLKNKKVDIDKGWAVMFFKNRGSKSVVGKDKDRKSFRYTSVHITEDEANDLEAKIRLGEVM